MNHDETAAMHDKIARLEDEVVALTRERNQAHEGWDRVLTMEIPALKAQIASLTRYFDGDPTRPTMLNAYGRRCYDAGVKAGRERH